MKTLIKKDTCTPIFTVALFTIAKTQKQPKHPSTDEWIKKRWYICMCVCVCVCIYVYMNITQPRKMNEIMPFAGTWMHLEIIILSKISQRKTNIT